MKPATNLPSFSLFELNEHLKRVIAFNMREQLWVRCEIADVGSSKGSVYLSLVERNDFKVSARADAVIWGRVVEELQKKIGDSLWSILQTGRQILALVQVEFHEYFGMKLSIKDIDPSVTIGQLELQRAQTLKKLTEEQFTTLNAQVATRAVWQRIAVISSATAAGLQDFLQQLQENAYGYRLEYELFNAVVQGANVGKEVGAALEKIEARQEEFDCVVIVRGGGARLDLMGFDQYDLCVAIATCELPVLTGIGHDIDETLADLVAYTSLKTPTAVAEYLVQRLMNYEQAVLQYAEAIQQQALTQIQEQQRLLERLQERLAALAIHQIERAGQELLQLEERLRLLNPQHILARGFAAVAHLDGRPITSIQELEAGQRYHLHLADGQITITIPGTNA
ncbi:MAG: exodeoxyribonuclease VII large subunit [Aureispira sp.]